jgi:hypothetical protein
MLTIGMAGVAAVPVTKASAPPAAEHGEQDVAPEAKPPPVQD